MSGPVVDLSAERLARAKWQVDDDTLALLEQLREITARETVGGLGRFVGLVEGLSYEGTFLLAAAAGGIVAGSQGVPSDGYRLAAAVVMACVHGDHREALTVWGLATPVVRMQAVRVLVAMTVRASL